MKPPPMSERAWMGRIVDLAHLSGWLVYHPPDNRPDNAGRKQHVTPGFPDLILVRGNRMVAAELKQERKAPTRAQAAWLIALDQVDTVTPYVWRPSDWDVVRQIVEAPR